MNEITLIQDGGPEAGPLSDGALRTARAALLAEIEGPAGARRRPARRTVLRVGAAVLAAAAAVTTAVLVGENGAGPQPGDGAVPVTLVGFDLPAFPLTLPTPPPGAADPVFGGAGNGSGSMLYRSIASEEDVVSISVGAQAPPPGGSLSFPGSTSEQITLDGGPALLITPSATADDAMAGLDWERRPGQWLRLYGQGRYAQGDLLTGIATALVDVPQSAPVQLHLAPAGYRLDFFKDGGRIVRLTDDTGTDSYRGLTVRLLADGEEPPGDAGEQAQGVTVQGQPAELARTDLGDGGRGGWLLRASLPDGTAFAVEAPGDLTGDQVVQIADQVSYSA